MAVQDSTFRTVHVEDNEIIKANDFEFAFEQLVENVSKATQMFLESTQDFVINGSVIPSTGMNVAVSPIFGVCKSTGQPFGRTETTDETIGFEGSSSGRIDIIQVRGEWATYDNQQRAFNDPDTDTQTYQYVDTKKLMKPVYQVKQGIEGAGVAPEKDSGWVKLAEVSIRAGATSILATDIHNITADVAGMDNDDWTTEKSVTYNIGYISDVNARFRVQHNEDGTHADDCIDANSLDIGTGVDQINGNILPVGATVSIPNETISAADSILSVLTKAASLLTSLYNDYLKYGSYGFKGELNISSVLDANNDLEKPITVAAAGDGTAVIKVDGNAVISIDANGKLSTNGYTATSNNHIVTKAVTDAISTALANLTNVVNNIVETTDYETYSNGVISSGTDGRYNIYSTNLYLASTVDLGSLSGTKIVDGVTPTDGVLILVKNQNDATQNGIYQYSSSSAWTRTNNFLTPLSLVGKLFQISNGLTNKGKIFYTNKVNFIDITDFGSDDIPFKEYFGSIQPIPSKLAFRDNSGNVKTGNPTAANDSTPLSFVKNSVIVLTTDNKTLSGLGTLNTNSTLKVMFTQDIDATDTVTGLSLSYNGTNYSVKIAKDGALVDFVAKEMGINDYQYLQAYTTLEMYFNGNQFVIIGNPIVISGNGYAVFADGTVEKDTEFLCSIPAGSSNDPTTHTGTTYTYYIGPDYGIEVGDVIKVTFAQALQSSSAITQVNLKCGGKTGAIVSMQPDTTVTNQPAAGYKWLASHEFTGGNYSATYKHKVWDANTTLELTWTGTYWLVDSDTIVCQYTSSTQSYLVKTNGFIEQNGITPSYGSGGSKSYNGLLVGMKQINGGCAWSNYLNGGNQSHLNPFNPANPFTVVIFFNFISGYPAQIYFDVFGY